MMMMIYYDVDCRIIFDDSSMKATYYSNPFSLPTPTGLNILQKGYWDLDLASLNSRPFANVASGISSQ